MNKPVYFADLYRFEQRWRRGEFGDVRLGQAFLNTYFPNVSDPDLYYETSRAKARAQIISNPEYITYEKS